MLRSTSPEYRQTVNNLIITLQEMKARAEKAKALAHKLGQFTLADDLQLYSEDLTKQIHGVNLTVNAHPMTAIAEL